jgi:glycosyltransferase involved in cell wall biosynthesis
VTRISVVLIVKDEPVIDKTIAQIYQQTNNKDAEIIVVDASEGRLSEIRQKHPYAVWLDFRSENPTKKISIPEQRNVGVRASNGQIIAFCDAGGSPQPGWLEAITAQLLSGNLALVGGPVFATNSSSVNFWTNLQRDGDEVEYPTTANLALTRSTFELVGGFNEKLNYGSDADLVWRLNDQGIKQICVEKAIMGLDGGTRKRELRRTWLYGKALADLLILHPKRRAVKVKSNPEIWIYPTLIAMALLTVPFFWFSNFLFFVFLVANLLLLIRNRKTNHPLQVVISHYVYSFSFCFQLLHKSWLYKKLLFWQRD